MGAGGSGYAQAQVSGGLGVAGVVGVGVCSGNGCRIGAGLISPMSVVHVRGRYWWTLYLIPMPGSLPSSLFMFAVVIGAMSLRQKSKGGVTCRWPLHQ